VTRSFFLVNVSLTLSFLKIGIFIQKDTNLPAHYNHYEREEDEDDDTDEFIHPNPYQQPFTRAAMFRPPVHKRRLSQHSQELISGTCSKFF
jgi:hypothetical protein